MVEYIGEYYIGLIKGDTSSQDHSSHVSRMSIHFGGKVLWYAMITIACFGMM